MRAAPTIQQSPDSKLLSGPGYGPFLCRVRLERVYLCKNQKMPLEELPSKDYNQFMDKRGRRWIGVHNQTFQTGGYGEDKPEKDVFQEDVPEGDVSEEEWAEKEGIEKDAPEGGEILESALSVHQAKEALRQRRPVSFGRRYHGLGGNGPGHCPLGPGADTAYGTD